MTMRLVLLFFLTFILLPSCTRTIYTPVESVHTEWRDRDVLHTVRDTVRDTRFVFVKGDSVIDVRDREHIVRIEVHDTLRIFINDTIPAPYPVEKELSAWQQFKIDYAAYSFSALALILIFLIFKIKRWTA
ncbi:MAG: hypothetical protein NC418_11540 [Muribaculaceae bacterium]|nr:hypothetical protein [Muribaculaceae bacterium]